MKPIIITILCLQIALGLLVAFVAFEHAVEAAKGLNWAYHARQEFEQMRQSPEFREPPKIHGYSLSDFIESMDHNARKRLHLADIAVYSGIGASLFAAVLLWLSCRTWRKPV